MSDATLDLFPPLNASLNGLCAVLLSIAYVLIKRRRYKGHAIVMMAAVFTSAVFLACYITYHAQRAPKSLGLPPSLFSTLYFVILISHTVLAVAILPLIGITLWRAYKRAWDRHRLISVITLPLWFYVSVTGVVIYYMLYHLKPHR